MDQKDYITSCMHSIFLLCIGEIYQLFKIGYWFNWFVLLTISSISLACKPRNKVTFFIYFCIVPIILVHDTKLCLHDALTAGATFCVISGMSLC